MSPSRIPRRGLLVIDMQHGLFYGAHRPYRADDVLDNINALIDRAHGADAPVFAARHVGPAGSPLADSMIFSTRSSACRSRRSQCARSLAPRSYSAMDCSSVASPCSSLPTTDSSSFIASSNDMLSISASLMPQFLQAQ